jgi:hypothetical protein
MTLADNQPNQAKAPDLSLILARLEKGILAGDDLTECRQILNRDSLWKQTPAEIQLKRAQLAQMAGEVALALTILAAVNATEPNFSDAWTERLNLLGILDEKEKLAQVLAQARSRLSDDACRNWLRINEGQSPPLAESDVDTAASPFVDLRRRQQQIAHYLNLFSGREDCFARQWVDRKEGRQGYVPVRRPMAPQDVEDHLRGRRTYGFYLLTSAGMVKTAVLDADLNAEFRREKLAADERDRLRRERRYLITRVREIATEIGMVPLSEFSGGKGFHFWFFFEPAVPAATAKNALDGIRHVLAKDLTVFNLEVFPKQERLGGKGLGNLVKLPLGIHRLSGKSSFFIDCHDRSTEAQLDHLLGIRPAPAEKLTVIGRPSAEVLVHPRMREWAEQYPELHELERCCPPLGQIIAGCGNEKSISLREEKVLLQTVGFLPRANLLLHHLLGNLSDYNPHLVNYRLSRLRGTPLGCRRIHALLSFSGEFCRFEGDDQYRHPLQHLKQWCRDPAAKAEKVENLTAALESLKTAMTDVQRFLK